MLLLVLFDYSILSLAVIKKGERGYTLGNRRKVESLIGLGHLTKFDERDDQ